MTQPAPQSNSLLDFIRAKLEARQTAVTEQIDAFPGPANPRDPGYRQLTDQRNKIVQQLNEIDAVERISGGDLSHSHPALANFIVGLTTLSEQDRMEIVQYAVEN